MEALVDAGLVRAIGVSNFSLIQIEGLLATCRIKPVVNQASTGQIIALLHQVVFLTNIVASDAPAIHVIRLHRLSSIRFYPKGSWSGFSFARCVMGPLHGTPAWDPCMGPLHGTPCMGPLHGTPAWDPCHLHYWDCILA
jgi:hypothetical protein